MMKRLVPFLLLFVLILPACRASSPAQASAERFLDAHYVRMNLALSHELAEGVARLKIAKEIELVSELTDQERPTMPRVHYSLQSDSLHSEHDGEGAVIFQYRLRIESAGSSSALEKLVLLTVREPVAGEGFVVTNFSDSDVLNAP
ncbi:MAG: hypothetical protein ACI8TX_002722 [Hyphomicrobiaceae bacterium]|jgi:hypothetical protein